LFLSGDGGVLENLIDIGGLRIWILRKVG
jgi:hypothetical protein